MAILSDTAVKWAADRGISRSTLERVGATSGTTGMPGAGECEVIAFPYRRAGAIVNVKYRALAEKAFKQQDGGELRFWNLDAALAAKSEKVYITEGEMDALALLEAGIPEAEVISIPNGAPVRSSPEPEEQDRYRYVDAGLEEGLSRCKRFVLATDGDPPGRPRALLWPARLCLKPAAFVAGPQEKPRPKPGLRFTKENNPSGSHTLTDTGKKRRPHKLSRAFSQHF